MEAEGGPPAASLRLALDPAALARLPRLPRLVRDGASGAVEMVWHDAEGIPIALLRGRRHRYQRDGVGLEVLQGTVRGVVADRSCCWITLTGRARPVAEQAATLAMELPISVPRGSLEAEAESAARGTPVPCHTRGPPKVEPQVTVSEALAGILLHLTGTLLHWADRVGGNDPVEAVHQARVASRRLRSALSVFRKALPCPALAELGLALHDCAGRLGQVRDWDVFLAGAGSRLAAAVPEDARYAAMLRAGHKRRAAARAELRAYLAGAEFRRMQVALASAGSLRPWEWAAPAGMGSGVGSDGIAEFAAQVLDHRARKARKAGRGLASLPTEALHELRKRCKRLRYAAEFFVPVFAHRHAPRYLRRLAAVQEELGLLNDTASVPGLMAQLGRPGQGHAGGLVAGFAAASSLLARERAVPVWKRFRAAEHFWDSAARSAVAPAQRAE